ncbi:hypothetical protein [Dyadobacter luticola]|uniref:DUF4402 domain-containing protein n=1 Tax=Dyadobacter luticola TaxID=1979387 RepID=A0A5R9L5M5_9BACT|nr:hypothetical protein [Dyadobacter luticola]TLV03873.1 hypothetical protein FEN17_09850 [Dyadobacter luticola]
MKKAILTGFLWLCSLGVFSQSITISNSSTGGTWSVPTLSSTITSAGKNYEHTETTGASHTLIKINSLVVWTVSVSMSTTSNWNSALKLSVRRTGDGTGLVTISGGTNYILLSSTPQFFFNGLLGLGFGRDNVPVQYKIEGLSVTLPVKTYTTTVLYTITGL